MDGRRDLDDIAAVVRDRVQRHLEAFYTDVSDAYRLSRRGRLRTNLGGVYFIVVATGVYLISLSLDVQVLLVVIQHLEIAHELPGDPPGRLLPSQ